MGVVTDVHVYLAAQGIVDGSTGWPGIRRRVLDSPDQTVVLTEDGGREPELHATSGIGDWASADVGLQVFVRGKPHDGDSSLAKATEIREALHSRADIKMNGQVYERVLAMTFEPIYLGADDTGRPQHTIAFRFSRQIN